MFIIETYEHARDWMKLVVGESFDAVVIIRWYDAYNDKRHWRERGDDAVKVLVGFGNIDEEANEKVVTGKYLKELGWDLQGVNIAFNYKILWK